MPSHFAWVDFSEDDRRRTEDVLDLLGTSDTVDELGLGVVRDALADRLFPGTSTLQTRARYFLFIPWTYLALAERGVSSADVAAKARKAELGLVEPLKSSEDPHSIIGALAGMRLKRLASTMYWAGLGTWGIRRFPGSQDQYHRAFAALHDDTPAGDVEARRVSAAWDPQLPPAPPDYPDKVTFGLTREEAEYLQHRIRSLGTTVLAELVRTNAVVEDVPFPWLRSDIDAWPVALREDLEHARNFSELMHGAALLYNLMLAEARHDESLVADYRAEFAGWAVRTNARVPAYGSWDREKFWALVASGGAIVAPRTRRFIDRWLTRTLSRSPASLADDDEARSEIRDRESKLKGGRARLDNPSALARWGGAAGAEQLQYRWYRVQTIVGDIQAGLRAGRA